MPALRPFSFYTQSASKSIVAYGCNLVDMNGTLVTGTAPLYFQLFDKASAAVANDVPIASYLISSSGPFPLASIFQTLGPITFTLGLAVGISSTDQKYTAATAAYDVWGDIEEGLQSTDSISGLTVVTDTGVSTSNIWSAGATANRLFFITITNSESVTVYPMLFNNGSYTDGSHPLITFDSIAVGATKTFYFGSDGLRSPLFFAPQKGANIALSTTAATYTTSADFASTIVSKYKA